MKNITLTVIFSIAFSLLFGQSLSKKNYEVGLAYLEIEHYSKAINYFEKSWNLRSETETVNKLIKTYMQSRDYKNALVWQKKISNKVRTNESKKMQLNIFLLNSDYKMLHTYLQKYKVNSTESWYKEIREQLDSVSAWSLDKKGRLKELKKINSVGSDVSPVPYESGIVFSSNRKHRFEKKEDPITGLSFYDLYQSKGSEGNLSSVKKFSMMLNSSVHETSLCFDDDDLDIYFTRTGKVSQKNDDGSEEYKMKLFRSRKEADVWSKPEPFFLNDSLDSFGQPFITKDGNLFFFASDMDGGYGGADLYVSKRLSDSKWSLPVNLGSEVNSEGNEMSPFYDEKGVLYFSSNGYFSIGGYDLFSSELINGSWSPATNLKMPINSSADDFSIFWLNDQEAYICSNRIGGTGLEDIYYYKKKI